MTKRTLTIEIEQAHDGAEANRALDQVCRDVAQYTKDRAARFLCDCAKVTIKEQEQSDEQAN